MRLALVVVALLLVFACSQETSTPTTPAKPAACTALAGVWTVSEARASAKDGSKCDALGGNGETYDTPLTIDTDLSRVVESAGTNGETVFTVESATATPIGEEGGPEDLCTIIARATVTRDGVTTEFRREIGGSTGGIRTIVQANVPALNCSVEFRGIGDR